MKTLELDLSQPRGYYSAYTRFPEGCGRTNTNTHTHSRHSSNERLLFKYQPNVPQFLQPYNEIRETTPCSIGQKTEQGKEQPTIHNTVSTLDNITL